MKPLLLLSFTLSLIIVGFAQEESLSRKDVPPTVLKTFQASYPHATIKGYSKEIENGITTYEIESVEGNVHRDVTYGADGSLVSVEESLPFSSVPEPVRNAVMNVSEGVKILFCEKIMKADTLRYEVLLTSSAGKLEVVLEPDGKIVATEKK